MQHLSFLVTMTRTHDALELGISPRGSLALFRSAQALAHIEGREFCVADDIKRLVIPCFAHRVIVNTREAEKTLTDILQTIPVPI